jgi:hypothetical protein
MALPKTFTGGERLFAEDLNDNFNSLDSNFNSLDSRTTALESAALIVETAGSNSITLNFSNDRLVTRQATGAIAVTGASYTAGKSVTLRIVAGASSRNISFPANWKFVSFKPTSIAASKTGILAVTSFGVTDADVVAAWAAEA